MSPSLHGQDKPVPSHFPEAGKSFDVSGLLKVCKSSMNQKKCKTGVCICFLLTSYYFYDCRGLSDCTVLPCSCKKAEVPPTPEGKRDIGSYYNYHARKKSLANLSDDGYLGIVTQTQHWD